MRPRRASPAIPSRSQSGSSLFSKHALKLSLAYPCSIRVDQWLKSFAIDGRCRFENCASRIVTLQRPRRARSEAKTLPYLVQSRWFVKLVVKTLVKNPWIEARNWPARMPAFRALESERALEGASPSLAELNASNGKKLRDSDVWWRATGSERIVRRTAVQMRTATQTRYGPNATDETAEPARSPKDRR
jgi:hypothetical protein